MLAQCRRRGANNNPALGQHPVFAASSLRTSGAGTMLFRCRAGVLTLPEIERTLCMWCMSAWSVITTNTYGLSNDGPMMAQCWANAGQILVQCWPNGIDSDVSSQYSFLLRNRGTIFINS